MLRIFRVTTKAGEVWEGAASGFDAAACAANRAFYGPPSGRLIKKIEVIKIVET